MRNTRLIDRTYCQLVTDAYSDYAFANYMYKYDATYREMIEEERRQREEQKAAVERYEAELDARNPLMTRFTRKVIAALEARTLEVYADHSMRRCDKIAAIYDLHDLKKKYRARLEHYQGLR